MFRYHQTGRSAPTHLALLAIVAMLATAWLACHPRAASAQPVPRRIIIDTDPGTDDALALLLALRSPEVRVEAITVSAGNVIGEQGLENARRLVSFAGRCEVPVVGGARRPLAQPLVTAEFWHGANGLAGIDLPESGCAADTRFAPHAIVELVRRYPGEITLVPVGPLTNIAMAMAIDPGIVPLVREVVLMGGALDDGNVTPVAEANIYGDPEAAAAVFNAGWRVTMVGLDVTHRTLFTTAHLERLAATQTPVAEFVVRVLRQLIALEAQYGSAGAPMHDPLAIGVVLDPSLVSTLPMRVDVELKGQFTRGQTVGNKRNTTERYEERDGRMVMVELVQLTPNAHVATAVDAPRFLDVFIERMGGR